MIDNEEMNEDKIIIPVNRGSIIAERNPDPGYDGVSIYFQDNNGVNVNLVIVEAKEEYNREQIDMYFYGDVCSEEFTDKISFLTKDIERVIYT